MNDNSECAFFKILPRYKVKSIGHEVGDELLVRFIQPMYVCVYVCVRVCSECVYVSVCLCVVSVVSVCVCSECVYVCVCVCV